MGAVLAGGSGGVLGASWSVLGRSWGSLGRSWGGLGGLLGALGPPLERHAKILKTSVLKMTHLGSPKSPKMAPQTVQEATKIRYKKRSEKRTEIRRK